MGVSSGVFGSGIASAETDYSSDDIGTVPGESTEQRALSGTTAGITERHGIRFERVVDAVDDLGMDPEGNTSIREPLLQSMQRGNELVEFPPGEYYIDDIAHVNRTNNWGVRGLGNSPTDVRIVSDTGASFNVLSIIAGTGVLVENLSIDYGFEQKGHLGMRFLMDDKIEVHDVHFVGFNPSENNGGKANLVPHVTDSDGVAVVDGLVRKGPTEFRPHSSKTNNPNAVGVIWMGQNHEGTIHIRNSHIENSGSNGVYASRTRGIIHYDNCLFRNNNMAAIRIGGGRGTHTVKGCVFEIDTDNPNTSDNVNRFINPVGAFVETNNVDAVPVEFTDCDFHWISGPDKGGSVFVDGSAGPVNFTNCRGRSESSSNEILTTRTDPRWSVAPDNQAITITDSHLTGQGGIKLVQPGPDGHRQVTVDGGCVSAPLDPEVTVSETMGTQQCDLPGGSIGADSSEASTDSSTVHELLVHGSRDGRSDYRIRYDGTASTDNRSEGDDTATDGVIEGTLWGRFTDGYQLEGSVVEIVELTNGATVTLDGERIDTTDATTVQELVVHGSGDGRSDYRIRYDGTASTDERGDTATDGVIEGSVWGSSEDDFQLEGSVVEIVELTNGATVTLDGERIDAGA